MLCLEFEPTSEGVYAKTDPLRKYVVICMYVVKRLNAKRLGSKQFTISLKGQKV